MAAPTFERIRPQDFAEWQLRQTQLYELVDGFPVVPLKMMAGATVRHDRVVVNCLVLCWQSAAQQALSPDDLRRGRADPQRQLPSSRPDHRMRHTQIRPGDRSDAAKGRHRGTVAVDHQLRPFPQAGGIQDRCGNRGHSDDRHRSGAGDHSPPWQRRWEAETVEGLDAVISFEGVIEAELAVRDIYEGLAFPSA